LFRIINPGRRKGDAALARRIRFPQAGKVQKIIIALNTVRWMKFRVFMGRLARILLGNISKPTPSSVLLLGTTDQNAD
jgi:hypothetical protein